MPLKIPKIDGEAYRKLLDEARARIPTYSPEWTDLSDAEVEALLEGALTLVARLSENPEILDRLREKPGTLDRLVLDLNARLTELRAKDDRKDNHVYTVDKGSGQIQFGDGVKGRRLPTGSASGSTHRASRREYGLTIARAAAVAAVAAAAGGITGYFLGAKETGTEAVTQTTEKTVTSTIDRPTTHTATQTVRETHGVPHTVTQQDTKTVTTTKTITREPGAVPVGMARSDNVQNAVDRAIELAEGLTGLEAGMTVLIKPNVNSDDPYPASTNPQVVGAIVHAVKRHDPGRVIVADCSNENYWPSLGSMQKTGIYQSATEEGAEVMGLERAGPWKPVKPEKAGNWTDGFTVPGILDEVDYLISLPVAKTHYIATYSMALKNTVGLIDRNSRSTLHSYVGRRFGSMIAEINLARPADYVILDATKVFVTGGPFTGDVREPEIVMATPDLVAADVSGLALLKHLGSTGGVQARSVWEQFQVMRAAELGLGVVSASQISVASEGIEETDEIEKHLI